MITKTSETSTATKIQALVESTEDFINAVVDLRDMPQRPTRSMVETRQQKREDTRYALEGALREFLRPRLRVIAGEGKPQPYAEGTPESDKPMCSLCSKTEPCAPDCGAWARAVRAATAAAKGE